MEAYIEAGILALLVRVMNTQRQISKWERELRKASERYEYSRQQTAERKLNNLNSQYDELMRQIRKRSRS